MSRAGSAGVGITPVGEMRLTSVTLFPFRKLVNDRDFLNLNFWRILFTHTSSWLTQEPLSQFFYTVLATLLLQCWCSTQKFGSHQIALQFGFCGFERISMHIHGSDFLHHHHLLVKVAGSHLLDASTLEPIPIVSSVPTSKPSELYLALLSTAKEIC